MSDGSSSQEIFLLMIDIGECSQVKWETRRYVNTSKPTLAAFENIIWTNVGSVEVGEFVSLKFGVSHSSICASAESFTTNINDLNCRDKNNWQGWVMKTRRKKRNGPWLKWCLIVTRREKLYPQNHLTRKRVSTIQADGCLVHKSEVPFSVADVNQLHRMTET